MYEYMYVMYINYALGLILLGLLTMVITVLEINILHHSKRFSWTYYFVNFQESTEIVLGEVNDNLSNDTMQRIQTTFANYSSRKCNFITFWWSGLARTGNLMFQYASFYALAKINKKIPFVKYKNFPLREGFRITIPYFDINLLNKSSFEWVPDVGVFSFTDKVFNLSCDKNYDQGGYRHGWKHFAQFNDEVRKEFQFVDNVKQQCDKMFHDILDSNNISQSNCLLIGAHMRRGDFITDRNIKYGFEPARADYLQIAIKFFENRYKNETCIAFIILGNDYEWNLQNSPNQSNVIVPKPHSSGFVDMCVLSRCNHTIISAGTYGWWVAFLAGGDATYQKLQCRPNSYHCSSMHYPSYINPKWNWFPL